MLSDVAIRKAAPADKDYKLGDSGGLYLLVTRSGAKSFRLKYRYGGKEHRLVFGLYPEVTLAEARDRRDEAKKLLRDGLDPKIIRRARIQTAIADGKNTFEAVAREWHRLNKAKWVTRHGDDVLESLERDVFPLIGDQPLRSITPPLVLSVVRAIEQRSAVETARRVRQRLSAVFVYGIASGICDTDPAAIIRGALAPLPPRTKQPAVIDLEQARAMLRAVDATAGHPTTKLAIRLLALTAVRPGELRGAGWDEFEGATWHVPAERMKGRLATKRPHDVPLSDQALEVLIAQRQVSGRWPLVFPSSRHGHRPMSENAMGYLLNRAGYHGKHVPHGFRACFSSIMNERFPADRAIIDLMLAHTPSNKVEAAYNRAAFMERRRELAQAWAGMLMEGMAPAETLLDRPRR